MTIKQLMEELAKYPDNANVLLEHNKCDKLAEPINTWVKCLVNGLVTDIVIEGLYNDQ